MSAEWYQVYLHDGTVKTLTVIKETEQSLLCQTKYHERRILKDTQDTHCYDNKRQAFMVAETRLQILVGRAENALLEYQERLESTRKILKEDV